MWLIDSLLPLPVRMQVGVAVTFNYFVILLGFTSFLIVDSVRIEHNLLDILCCVPAWWRKGKESQTCLKAEENHEREAAVAIGTPTVTDIELKCATSTGEQKSGEIEEIPSESDHTTVMVVLKRTRRFLSGHSVLTKLVERAYSPLVQNHFVKLVIIVFFACVFLPLAIMGCLRVKDGLNLLEVVPEGTPEYGFVSASLNYFSYFDTYVVTGEMNYPERQPELLQLHDDILGLDHIIKDSATGESPFWLKTMIQYYEDIHHRACVLDEESVYKFIYHLLLKKVYKGEANCSFKVVVTKQHTVGGVNRTYNYIKQDYFYQLLIVWVSASLHSDKMAALPLVFCST